MGENPPLFGEVVPLVIRDSCFFDIGLVLQRLALLFSSPGDNDYYERAISIPDAHAHAPIFSRKYEYGL